MKIEKGRVKKFFSERGFGFIEYGAQEDIFFHVKELSGEAVQEGDEVEFIIGAGKDSRPAAKKVRKVTRKISAMSRLAESCSKNGFQQNGNTDAQFFLPKDTRNILVYSRVDNFILKLNKCIKFTEEDQKLKAKIEDQEISQLNDHLITKINERQNSIIDIFTKEGYSLFSLKKMEVDWRLVVGLGSASVYETSLTLHHIYGVPFIPGSALKGAARSYYLTRVLWSQFPEEQVKVLDRLLDCGYESLQQLREEKDWQTKMEKKLTVQDKRPTIKLLKTSPDEITGFREASLIFGNQKKQGKVCFLDAFPAGSAKIEKDIVNPHFSDYYRENAPPADYLSPQPIFFLTVKDVSFNFYLLARAGYEPLLTTAGEWLKGALTTCGVGAKTAVGYGYFKDCDTL